LTDKPDRLGILGIPNRLDQSNCMNLPKRHQKKNHNNSVFFYDNMSTEGEPPKKKQAIDALKPKNNGEDLKIDWNKKICWKNNVLPNILATKMKPFLQENYGQTITGLEFRQYIKIQ
jgi:hypothetical protein